jgi:hypothetical protein
MGPEGRQSASGSEASGTLPSDRENPGESPPSTGGSCILKLFSVGCTGKIRGFLEWWFRPLPKVLYLFLYSACIQFEFGEPASAS